MVVPWKNIDLRRRELGLTLKALAHKAGVSETAIQKWKNGRPITYETLERLAAALDTTAVALNPDIAAPRNAGEGQPPAGPAGDVHMVRESPANYGAPESPAALYGILSKHCEELAQRMSNVERLLISLLAEERRRDHQPVTMEDAGGNDKRRPAHLPVTTESDGGKKVG